MKDLTRQTEPWQRQALAVAAGVAAAVAVVLAVLLLWDAVAVPLPPQVALLLVGLTQGVLCLLISGAIAPRRSALLTLLLTMLVSPLCEWAQIAPTYARMGFGAFHLPPGVSVAEMLAVGGTVAISAILTMWALRKGRRRMVVVLTACTLLTAMWYGSWWYYGTLNELNPQCLQPQVTKFLQAEVLPDVGPVEWLKASWYQPLIPREFSLVTKPVLRSDGSPLFIILKRIPRARFGHALLLGELEFPEPPKGSRGNTDPSFTVLLRHLPNSRTLTPERVARLGWLRPELSRRLVATGSEPGVYVGSACSMRIVYQAWEDAAYIRFFGTYRPGGRVSAAQPPPAP